MQKVEKILLILFCLGLILRTLDFIGGSIVVVIFGSSLSVIYFFFTFAILHQMKLNKLFTKTTYSSTSLGLLLGSVILGIGLSIWLMSLVFHVQNWGLGFIFPAAAGCILIISAVLSAFFVIKTKNSFYTNALIRVAGWLVLGLIFMNLKFS